MRGCSCASAKRCGGKCRSAVFCWGCSAHFFALFGLSERFRGAFLWRFGAVAGDRGVGHKASDAVFLRALSLAVGSGMAADEAAKLASALPETLGARARAAEALRRAAVSQYAAEGRYPASAAELREIYGVQTDESRYRVHYRVFAANLMPEIRVTVRTK